MAVIAIHPGEHLGEELRELGMSAAELARKLDVPTNRITGILNGQRAITGDTALRLAHFFGTSRGVLAQPAKPLRTACGEAANGTVIRRPSNYRTAPPVREPLPPEEC